MSKDYKFGISLLLALSISFVPFGVSKAETMEENELVTYESANLDQLLLNDDSYEEYNLNVSDSVIENDDYAAEGDKASYELEQISNDESTNDDSKKENLNKEDLEDNIEYKANEESSNEPKNKKIEEKISHMTLDEKIGQMLMLEFRNWEDENGELKEVTELNDDIKNAIKKYRIGGIILFAENVRDTEQTTKLTHNIQKTAIENGLDPLLISIDQEGGIVVRLGTGTSLPGNMALGATKDKKLAYEYGKIIAEEIKALGINVNLAPVMDTNNNPSNPVIGLRSISSDPKLVGELGSEIVKGLQENGVSAAVKHFPGHGDTAVDSHLGLPVVDKSYKEVEYLELIPFNKASNEGVDMIMTAHISFIHN